MKLLLKNGRVLDPATDMDAKMDLLIEDDTILMRKENMDEKEADEVIDVSGCYVTPGLIDLHVHSREPGFEHKGTIETETKAMAKGGFTTVCPMPNTKPATDCAEMVWKVLDKAKEVSPIHVLPVGAITIGEIGEERTDLAAMKEAGIVAISEDGRSVMNAKLYEEAMKEAARLGLVVLAHCEDRDLVGHGCMNLGEKSREFGVEGISNAVEDVIVARDILLAKETGVRLHLCHCSTRDSVKMIQFAKENGVDVTGEVCPHHFTLSTDDMVAPDPQFKMNPPLREKEDVEALKAGLGDGIMDVISTDHAPHAKEEKNQPIDKAPFGIIGSETAVALTMTELVKPGILTPMEMVRKMSYNPAQILGIDKGSLAEGKIADITVINPDEEWTITEEDTISKGKNTPFYGRKVFGRVKYTIVDGQVVYRD